MITTIKNLLDDESGSVAIESTFAAFFFAVVLTFSMYKSIQYVQYLKANKIAIQVAEIISQRNVFFNGRDLFSIDGILLNDVLESLVPGFSKSKMTIIIEENAYATGLYHSIELSSVKSYCRVKKRLDDYGINVITSYGKSNAIYRVTVCLRNMSDYFLDTPEIVTGVALEPGHHH